MYQPAWRVPPSSVALAALVCFAMSTQLLFQRALYAKWPLSAIGSAWLSSLADLALIAAAVLAVLLVAGRLPVRRAVSRGLLFAAALLTGAMLGEWLVLWWNWGSMPAVGPDALWPRAARWLPIGGIAGAIVVYRQRAQSIAAQVHETEIARLQLERQRVAVQLQVLQSQIEPHFLFNTLATIRRLHQTDPTRGRETLADFIHYLRSALPEMRSPETTLGREVDLITAYLDVLRVRMGPRLEFGIDVPASLRGFAIPPLSLATLVENAVKHGLAALPEGGRLDIRAWREGPLLKIRVADTGIGLTSQGGTGTGLANLRMRLRALYGDAGRLLLAPNEPHGLAITLHVPVGGSGDERDHA
jgi:hypothetical protein